MYLQLGLVISSKENKMIKKIPVLAFLACKNLTACIRAKLVSQVIGIVNKYLIANLSTSAISTLI